MDRVWVAALVRWAKRCEQRPADLLVEVAERAAAGVGSLVPVVEFALGFRLVEKFAWRRSAVRAGVVPAVCGGTLPWIDRVNFRLTNAWDLGGEGRFLGSTFAQDLLRGALVEVDCIIQKPARFGLGYSSSRFFDEEFGRLDEDRGGVLLRVVAHC